MKDRIILYGTTWCPDCRRAKHFLDEHRIAFDFVDIEKDENALKKVEEINHGKHIVPTLILPDGRVTVNPDNRELANELGLQIEAKKKVYDVIMVGGGPASLTAAIYTSREGMDTLVIERSVLGGQAATTNQLDNYPGFDQGISGADFSGRLTRQAKRFNVEILQSQEVMQVGTEGKFRTVETADGQKYCARAILIATGSKYRRLNVPGEEELIGVNIHFCATCDASFYKGREVLVVGGGNSGFQEALFLTRFASKITILEVAEKPVASKILQEKVEQEGERIEVRPSRAVKEFVVQDGKLASVRVENLKTKQREDIQPAGVFIFIGLTPNTAWLPETIERDTAGFTVTDKGLMTSLEGVFAAGDCRKDSTKQLASAVGEGASAAIAIREYIEKWEAEGSVPACEN